MRREVLVTAALLAIAIAAPARAEDREYRVGGSVVDTEKRPLAGVTVEIRERTSRRAYKVTSDDQGVFKMVGLPHGIYEVRFGRPGFEARTDEWNLSEPQSAMKKVEFNPYVMLTEQQVADNRRGERLQQLFEEAKELVRKGDTAAARPLLEKLLAERPDDANAHYLFALCLLQAGDHAAGAEALRRVIAINPGFAPAHTNLGVCHEQLGDTEQALAEYDAALAIDPASPLALYNAGVLRFNAKEPARALPYFEKLLAASPDDDRALEMAGYCELQNAAYDRALAYLERARPLITDAARAATIDEIIKELKGRVPAAAGAPGGGA